jgi:predicted secreted protein
MEENNETAQSSKLHENLVIDKELVMSVLKQNGELMKENNDFKQMLMETQNQVLETQNQVMELLKKGTHNTTNSHNKTFNLNFFLNETCKNAMNIMDFVNNLQLQLSDLEKMEDVGYVNGMSNIIIKNLKDMDVTERPVHCTDAKREVLYVKDEDKWDKETSDKPKIRKAIKHVAHKNARLLQEFKEKHPDCTKSESKHSDTYTKLMVEAMGGKGSNDDEQESKIIKKVSKEITLDNLNQ